MASSRRSTTEPGASSRLTVLKEPTSLAAAIKAMDADGGLTAVVPVGIWSLIDSRVEEDEESGEDYAIVAGMIAEPVIPMQMGSKVAGVRPDNVLLLEATFELEEALATSYDEDEIAELEEGDEEEAAETVIPDAWPDHPRRATPRCSTTEPGAFALPPA